MVTVKSQLSCVYRLLKDFLYYINIPRFSGQIQANRSGDLSEYSLITLLYELTYPLNIVSLTTVKIF